MPSSRAKEFTRLISQILSRARCSRAKILRGKHCRNWSIQFGNTASFNRLSFGRLGTRFELIAGERRWRAAQEAGLTQAPVIIRSAGDMEVLELSLIENLQRADLNPIEEAQGYARLASEFGMRQEDIALKVGRSRAAVANAMRLLDLHPQVQIWLAQDLLSVGHAKVLLALKAPEEQLLAAETVLRRNATVRSTERLVARQLGIGRSRRKSRRAGAEQAASSATIEHLQNRLQEHLATHVSIHHGEKRGRIEIEYYGNDDLQRVVTALGLIPERELTNRRRRRAAVNS